jgi:thiamine thiazole synthase
MVTQELEGRITELIVKYAAQEWMDLAKGVDVVVVGAGPAGLTAAKYLAEAGLKTVVFERRLSFGGGIGGGGMLFHKVIIDGKALDIIRSYNINVVAEEDGLYVIDAAELMSKLAARAIDAGAKIIHGVHVDDVIYRDNPVRIEGVAIQWSAVVLSGLHVDPLMIRADATVDATGHDAEVLSVVARKIPDLNIMVPGERSVYSKRSEDVVVEHTGKVVPGLYAAGMAVSAVYELPRMGPIFSSMLLSGKKVAGEIIRDLRKGSL